MYEKVISEYEKNSAQNGMKVVRIDATKPISEVSKEITQVIESLN